MGRRCFPSPAVRPARPAALNRLIAVLLPVLSALSGAGRADDSRLSPLKDLDGFFPFTPPASVEAWHERAAEVRQRVLVSQGLWPPPSKTPLNPVIHGTIEVDDALAPGGGYTVSKVFFESLPGFFVTGNLYRPRAVSGKVPGVLFSHGHKQDARLAQESPEQVRRQIATGAERFERGGRSIYQSMCVQLARMGCVVWHWDMLGNSDSQQLSRELVHGFAKQRPEMNRPDRWGLFSPQAESRLQNVMGLQTWNSIRSLDFLLSLPDVDPDRVAMTGSSGGGTQTMLLAAVDDRLALAYPVVMVSTSMQGGCTCENASLLRIGTGNVEFAALFAPKPQGMNTADDWTREMATKGFPDLERLYDLLGSKNRVMLFRAEHFPHNYNAVNRSAFYSFLNRQFRLGFPEPVIEHDFEPLAAEQLSVWNASHPAPAAADPEFERNLLAHLAGDIDAQIRAAVATPEGIKTLLEPAFATLIGRSFATAGDVEWREAGKDRGGEIVRLTGVLANTTHDEEVPVTWLIPGTGPGPADWSGNVVVWLDTGGRAALAGPEDAPATRLPAKIRDLLAGGTAVLVADLFHAREAAASGETPARQRAVKNPREFAGFTFGYNDPAIVRSAHDVLTILFFLKHTGLSFLGDTGAAGGSRPPRVGVAGFGAAAPVVLLARTVAGEALDRAAIDTGGFRFASLADWRHPLFLPGAVRYLDVPGLVAAGAAPLRLAGETTDTLLPITRQAIGSGIVGLADGSGGRAALAAWLGEGAAAAGSPK